MAQERSLPQRISRTIARALVQVGWFGVFHPKTVVVAVLVLTLLAGWSASTLRLSTSIESLLPKDIPAAERLAELRERWGSSEPIVLAISGRGQEDVDDRVDLALTIRDKLEERAGLTAISGAFSEDPWTLLEGDLAEALALYLSPEDIATLAGRLDAEGIDERVADNRARLRSPIGPAASRLIAEDPLGLLGHALERLDAVRGNLRIASRDGVLLTEDEETAILLVRAQGSTDDYQIARQILEEVREVARASLDELGLEGSVHVGPPELAEGEQPGAQIHVGLTGAPAILVDYHEILARDIRGISVYAFVAVLLLFLLAFRRPLGLVVAGVPLVVGVTWALGFAALVIGEISVFTAGSVAILCGLAIDFTIHLYNRYLEEVHAGKDMAEAFRAAHGETGLGIVAAAGTTAWAFLAAGFSTFRGLRDLGLLCAAGMVLSLIAALVLVPALTALFARMSRTQDRPRGLASFGLGPLLALVVRHRVIVAIAGLLATIGLGIPALRMHLDEDFRRFRPSSAPSIRLQDALVGQVGTALQPVIALVPGATRDEVVERSVALERELAALVRAEEPMVTAVIGPGKVLPAPSAQRAALEALEVARAEGLDPTLVERALLEALERHGFRVDTRAERAAARSAAILAREEAFDLDEAHQGPLAAMLDDLVIRDGKGGFEGVVSIYPGPRVPSRPLLEAIESARARAGVEADLVGGRVLGQEVNPIVRRDAIVAFSLSSVGVILILSIVFRRVVLVVLTFVPLIVGIIGSVGLMALLGIDFNLVSLSMLPVILGIGIDNGIHVVHRYLHHRSEDLVEVFRHTGRGIVMTSLTTMVGFGAMVFADYPGLISSGVLAILGVGATLVTAVFLVPAFLALLSPSRRGQESARGPDEAGGG